MIAKEFELVEVSFKEINKSEKCSNYHNSNPTEETKLLKKYVKNEAKLQHHPTRV